MKKSRFTEEQIAFAFKQAGTGTRIDEICRKNPMICSSVNLIFFMPVILHGDGLHKHYFVTAGSGQVIFTYHTASPALNGLVKAS